MCWLTNLRVASTHSVAVRAGAAARRLVDEFTRHDEVRWEEILAEFDDRLGARATGGVTRGGVAGCGSG